MSSVGGSGGAGGGVIRGDGAEVSDDGVGAVDEAPAVASEAASEAAAELPEADGATSEAATEAAAPEAAPEAEAETGGGGLLSRLRAWVRRTGGWPAAPFLVLAAIAWATIDVHGARAETAKAVALRDVEDWSCEVTPGESPATGGTVTVLNRGGNPADYAVSVAYVGKDGQVVAEAHARAVNVAVGATVTVPVSAVRMSAVPESCHLGSAHRTGR